MPAIAVEKRYQVFISSTYENLKAERQEIIQALLELNCFPAGMEMFPASDEEKWKLIAKVIEESDYMVIVLSGKYGSIGSNGVGYTEMEYLHAQRIGKPVIAFLVNDLDNLRAELCEHKTDLRDKLVQFRRKLEDGRIVRYWTNKDDLAAQVSRGISQLILRRPSLGWSRADISEINSILHENRTLRLELENAKRLLDEKGVVGDLRNLQKGRDIFQFVVVVQSPNKVQNTFEVKCTWDEVFMGFAELTMQWGNLKQPAKELAGVLERIAIEKLHLEEPESSRCSVPKEFPERALTQMIALKLACRSVTRNMQMLALTEVGKDKFYYMRAQRRMEDD